MNRLQTLEVYIKETPNDPFLHFAIAKEYESLGDVEKAVTRYELLMERYPEYVGTYYHAGKMYEKLHQIDRALQCYERGLEQARIAKDRHSASELAEAKESLEDSL
ncbi:MAG: tetratricopeptide repeat protein [Saprospiraceae bacterium]|nr:tetratricopeptide repeat protein [Saprospiraceae bacterium]